MANPEKLWEAIQTGKLKFSDLNEKGKKTYLQYGYKKGFIKEEQLTDKAKALLGIKTTPDFKSRFMAGDIKPPEGPSPQEKAFKAIDTGDEEVLKQYNIDPQFAKSSPVLAKLLYGAGQAVSTPIRLLDEIPFLRRTADVAASRITMQDRPIETTGSAVGDIGSEIAGTVLGYITPLPSMQGETLLRSAQRLSLPAAQKVGQRIGGLTGKLAEGFTREAIEGGLLGGIEGIARGERGTELGKRVALEAGVGGVLGAGFEGVAGLLSRAATKVPAAKVPQPEESVQKILKRVSVGERPSKPITVEKLYIAVFDDLKPLERVVKDITGGEKIATSENPFELAWLQRGWQGKAETFLKYGVVDENFNKIGKSFREIINPVKNQLDNFRAYSIARRAKELADRGIETGLDIDDINKVLDKFKDTNFEKVFEELVDYQDKILNRLVEAGILSKKALAQIKKLNKDYIPFYRIIEHISGKGTGKGLQAYQPIKRIKGSQRDIVDPLESIIKNTYVITNLVERNRVGRSLVDLSARYGRDDILKKIKPKIIPQQFELDEIKKALTEAGADIEKIDLDKIATIFRPAKFQGKDNVITVFINGKPQYYEVMDEALYRTMTGLDRESSSTLIKLLSFPARVLRAGATLTPEFAARNPLRDMWTAFIYSKYGFVPGVDSIRGLFYALSATDTPVGKAIKKINPKAEDIYYKWLASGGANSALVSLDRNYLQKNLRELLRNSMRDKTLNIITNPIEMLRAFSEFTEQATRLGEFAKGIAKEGTTAEGIRKAALSSRDVTLDFARSGTATRQINKIIAFFNAQMQGIDKMAREFKNNPVKSTVRATTAITLPSILLYYINKNDPRYQELPQWQKDLFWIIPTKNTIYRIPKPFELGVLFGALPERILQWLDENDPKIIESFGKRLAETFTPEVIPTALAPVLGAVANYDWFMDRPVVPMSEQRLIPSEQYGPFTSETAKTIGRLTGQSPRIIDYLIRGYGGGLGRYSTNILDALIKGKETPPKPEASLIESIPGLKGLTTRAYSASYTIDRIYDELKELEAKYSTARTRGREMAKEEIKRLKMLRKYTDRISRIRKKISEIYLSKDLSPEEKRKQIEKYNIRMINLARKAYGREQIK